MAVYTELSDDELVQHLEAYDIGTLTSLKGIAEGVENSNFLVRTTQGTFILTLYEKRVEAADLPFFLGLMEHLAARGITCPRPIHSRAGTALGRLAGRPAALVSFLDGVSVRRPSARHTGELGAALARLHDAGKGFALTRANALGQASWRPLFAQSAALADSVEPGLAGEILAELDELEARWPKALPQGVIHADLFPDNVFFLHTDDGDRLSGLIDFYFACNDWFAYDLAICLNSWCFENDGSFNLTKGRALINAYGRIRPLQPEEERAFVLLCRGSALRFLLTRLHDWLRVPPGALVTPKDPLEYLKKLRFHRKAVSMADYGWGL